MKHNGNFFITFKRKKTLWCNQVLGQHFFQIKYHVMFILGYYARYSLSTIEGNLKNFSFQKYFFAHKCHCHEFWFTTSLCFFYFQCGISYESIEKKHCIKYRNFTWFSNVGILWKDTVPAEFWKNRRKLYGNCAFPQNFYAS